MSILFIYLLHTGWNYMLQMCSTKKKKNLVKIQNEKYTAILNGFNTTQKTSELNDPTDTLFGMTDAELAEMEADLAMSLQEI